ncbi:hypothetical protein Plhal304r1_c013g0050311 [Plasmopara halstedii]
MLSRVPIASEPSPHKLEDHGESPNGDRPKRHSPPPTRLDENGGAHYHVERLVG